MDILDFREKFVAYYQNFWLSNFDDAKDIAWFDVLKYFNLNGLKQAIVQLAQTEEKEPSISLIIKTYEDLKKQKNRHLNEKEKSNFARLKDKERSCIYCNDTGLVSYFTDIWKENFATTYSKDTSYEICCRCDCVHSRIFNKFSKFQTNKKEMQIYNEDRGSSRGRVCYIPILKEARGIEFYNTFIAYKKAITYEIDKMDKDEMISYVREKVDGNFEVKVWDI